MRACPRDVFVPEPYREEAFVDAPIRVEAHEFNISAPHMHATCLEALALTPGLKARAREHARWVGACAHGTQRAAGPARAPSQPARPPPFFLTSPSPLDACLPPTQAQVLDVGSGCGVLTACIAHLVGRTGTVVGIDIRRECVRMGRESIRRLAETSPE